MRQIVLDTETTGLELTQGHRIIEIGCVELLNRRATGRHFHRYLNPERDIDEGARRCARTDARAALDCSRASPTSSQALLEFISRQRADHSQCRIRSGLSRHASSRCSTARTPVRCPRVCAVCPVLDTLTLARERHPGQRNNLDALCKRYGIDNSHRELHGALLDARILADVYLAMTGGQSVLALEEDRAARAGRAHRPGPRRDRAPDRRCEW